MAEAAGSLCVPAAAPVAGWPAATSVDEVLGCAAAEESVAGGLAADGLASGVAALPVEAVVVLDWPAVAWFADCWLVSMELAAPALDWLLMSAEVEPVVEALLEGCASD